MIEETPRRVGKTARKQLGNAIRRLWYVHQGLDVSFDTCPLTLILFKPSATPQCAMGIVGIMWPCIVNSYSLRRRN